MSVKTQLIMWLLIVLVHTIKSGIGVELTVTPSPVTEGGLLTLTCAVTENSSVYAAFNYENGTGIGFVQLSRGQCIYGASQPCNQQCSCTTDGKSFSWIISSVTRSWDKARVRCLVNNPTATNSELIVVSVLYHPTGTLTMALSGTQSVLTGTPVILQCQVGGGNPLATLTWQCKGSPMTGQDLTNTTTAVSSLTFTVDRTYHQQQCVCTAGHQASPDGQFGTVSVGFNVIYPPTGTLTLAPYGTQSVLTGTPVTLQCHVGGGNPLATLTWQCKGSPVPGQDLTNTTTAVSSLTFTVDRTYHQQQCVCTAGHQASPGGQFGTVSVGFNVIYPPTGTLTIATSGRQSVLTGTPVTLQCHVGGGNPLATLTWQCKGSPVAGQDLTNTTTAVASLTFTVDRTYHQQQCVCTAGHQASPGGQFGTVSVGFNVIYPPTGTLTIAPSGTQSVLTGTPVTLQCQVGGGNPLATLTWQCKGSPVPGQDLTNTTTAVSSLTFTVDMTYHQQQCVCTAGHQASPGGQFGTVSISFQVNSLPAIVINPLDNPYVTRENQTGVTFTCAATSTNPPVTSIVWMKGSKTVSTIGHYNLPVITRDLAGVYTCSATNDVGTTTANITMEVLSNPEKPHLLGIVDVTSSSLSVKWAVYDRSSLAVNVTYVCVGCEVSKFIYVNLSGIADVHVTTLRDLQADTQYDLRLTAANLAGSSKPLRFISSTSPACDERSLAGKFDNTSTISTALLVVGIVLSLIGLTACGLGIFLYRKARLVDRSANQNELVTKSETFRNVMHMETERGVEDTERSSHYEELRQHDIGKPSIYECPSPAESTAESRSESHQSSQQHNQESKQGEYSTINEQAE